MVRAIAILSLLCVVGCTAAERADLASDLAPVVPVLVPEVATGNWPAAIVTGVGAVAAAGAAWFVRKFIQKKYAAKE